jgi:hypothetical protein
VALLLAPLLLLLPAPSHWLRLLALAVVQQLLLLAVVQLLLLLAVVQLLLLRRRRLVLRVLLLCEGLGGLVLVGGCMGSRTPLRATGRAACRLQSLAWRE